MVQNIPKEILLKMYRDMVTGRKLDEAFLTLSASGYFEKDLPHRGAGEEAVVAGICATSGRTTTSKSRQGHAHASLPKGFR